MKVIVNSSSQVDLNGNAIAKWENAISESLDRFSDWVTRVEVHLTDENSDAKGGSDDIRCMMEARPASLQPVHIEVRAASVDQAMMEAIDTLRRRLSTIADKARSRSRKPQ